MPKMVSSKRAEDTDPGQNRDKDEMQVAVLRLCILSYFSIVRKTINDLVPKTIISLLVSKSKLTAQHILVQRIYQDGLEIDELMGEDASTRTQRLKCEDMVKTMRSSLEFLNEVRDFYFEETIEGR